MYSQNDEEKVILEYFGDKKDGKFLDLGAYDGKTFSNTLALAERGWSGVCVEASPQCFVSLQTTYRGNDKVKLVCCAVGDVSEPTLQVFHDSGGAVASLNEEHCLKWKDHQTDFMDIHAPVFPFSKFIGDFDFVDIDVEGISMVCTKDLLPSIDASLWCVEYDSPIDVETLKNIFKQKGYDLIHKTGENLIFGKAK